MLPSAGRSRPQQPAALCWTGSPAGRGPGVKEGSKTGFGVEPPSWRVFPSVAGRFPVYPPGPRAASLWTL